ncbi:MAG: hypothetical protein JXB03_09235 [Spirochaetales bacterium]|nr:hypothetical protein [Spirochaetales bacterium]
MRKWFGLVMSLSLLIGSLFFACSNSSKDSVDGDLDGIFVSASGSDTSGNGSQALPFATLTMALSIAAEGDSIFLDTTEDIYDSTLTITADNLVITGGYNAEWDEDASATACLIITDSTGFVLSEIDGFELLNLSLEVASGSAAGENSIGLLVANSNNIVLQGVTVFTGNGVNGAVSQLSGYVFGTVPDGNDGDASTGGAAVTYTSVNGETSTGGAGGDPAAGGENGLNGFPAGAGGQGSTAGSGLPGSDGADGSDGSDGVSATVPGTMSATGWTAAPGGAGEDGTVGQGGGGGCSGDSSGGGGSGAPGGGGGAGAGPSQGGGASIAVCSYQSDIQISDSILETGIAGNGGNGVFGQSGQYGGSGGLGAGFVATYGGNGGRGGTGGASGGAAGGISVGILYYGTIPVIDTVIYVPGSAGLGGMHANAGEDGIDGVAMQTLEMNWF